jgi:hypothetical protein
MQGRQGVLQSIREQVQNRIRGIDAGVAECSKKTTHMGMLCLQNAASVRSHLITLRLASYAMDKTIRWNVSPKELQEETYRYWQGVPLWERLCATSELSIEAYSLRTNAEDEQRLPGDPFRAEPPGR